jgi:hypothetical protein
MSHLKSKKAKTTRAQKADKYACYQASVQTPDHEITFFQQVFREHFKRTPLTLREDFCGTFAVCCHWVASHRSRRAWAIDLDAEPLAWGRKNNLAHLSDSQQTRVTIWQQDVRKKCRQRVDVLAAQNFSFWIFKTRDELRDYFVVARSHLNPQGLMILDMMGGGDCFKEGATDKKVVSNGKSGFEYNWRQDRHNPITADARFYISFKFSDGSRLKNVFEYNWRFWTIPEVREVLQEAGFSATHVYWEIEYEDGSSEWHRRNEASSDRCWISYIVAIR